MGFNSGFKGLKKAAVKYSSIYKNYRVIGNSGEMRNAYRNFVMEL